MNIEWVDTHSPLKRTVWRFYLLNDTHLVLDSYCVQEKESTRKKNWTTIEYYERLSHNRYKYGWAEQLTAKQVPFTPEVAQMVKVLFVQQFASGLTVGLQK